MSDLQRGRYHMKIIDSTGQWEIMSHFGTEKMLLSGDHFEHAQDIASLIDAYKALIRGTQNWKPGMGR